jgi:hypothetical protein
MTVSFIALMMEAVPISETLVNSYQSPRRYNPEDGHLHYLQYFVPVHELADKMR